MAHGVTLEAQYADDFTLTEDAADVSPYDEGRNVFHAIVNFRPVSDHGPMVRWTAFTWANRYDVDWRGLPPDARPVYFRDMERDSCGGEWVGPARVLRHVFGYEYEENGQTVREVQEIGA